MAFTNFTESHLAFSFDHTYWEVVKYDEHPKYIEISNALNGTKAIDFMGFYNKTTLVVFEVKGFRGYGSAKSVQERLAEGMEVLTTEIAQKVKDTVAGIIGISRNIETKNTIWEKAAKQILQNRNLIVIAWIEEDLTNKVFRDRKKQEMNVRTSKLKNKLSWLTTNISIDNVKERHFGFEGFTVAAVN